MNLPWGNQLERSPPCRHTKSTPCWRQAAQQMPCVAAATRVRLPVAAWRACKRCTSMERWTAAAQAAGALAAADGDAGRPQMAAPLLLLHTFSRHRRPIHCSDLLASMRARGLARVRARWRLRRMASRGWERSAAQGLQVHIAWRHHAAHAPVPPLLHVEQQEVTCHMRAEIT